MTINKNNIYNNLINLTRNEKLYKTFTSNDTFNDRLIIFLLHLSFFFENYKSKSKSQKKNMQELFDYCFRQIESSIREVGHGDVTVNKKMKEYINFFYFIVKKTNNWHKINIDQKIEIVQNILHITSNCVDLVNYIDKYINFLSNNTLNSFSKSVLEDQF